MTYKIVPIDPTPEMLDAGYEQSFNEYPDLRQTCADIYRAMVAAATEDDVPELFSGTKAALENIGIRSIKP